MPLARFDTPFEHPIFEPKLDGFRALAYVEGGACRLVSRNPRVKERVLDEHMANLVAALTGVSRAGSVVTKTSLT
jgi:hypothetical protein